MSEKIKEYNDSIAGLRQAVRRCNSAGVGIGEMSDEFRGEVHRLHQSTSTNWMKQQTDRARVEVALDPLTRRATPPRRA